MAKGSLKAVGAFADRAVWPVATGTVAGVVANQMPQNRKSSKKAKEEIKEKLGKSQIFKSDNPDFNQEAANKAYNLVMKMDLDEARLFSQMVVGEILENDIDRNLRTLQSHLNQVVTKRGEKIKKALMTSVSKGGDGLQFAHALVELEKAWSNPYQTGAYSFKESDFRRDPHSGQFRVKVKHNPNHSMLEDSQVGSLGINPNNAQYQGLSNSDKKRYQQEYMQVANFLNAVAEGGNLGDHRISALVEDRDGNRYHKEITGPPGPSSDERILEVSARPDTLKLGGAAFGLTNALGAPIKGSTVRVLNRSDDKFNGFSDEWTDAKYDPTQTNRRLYGRVAAGSKFVEDVAPFGSHAQIAARMARVIGDHGPEAEKVFGPAARRTAYRYRGTEKAPDPELVRAYEHAYRVGQNRDFAAGEREQRAEGGVVLTPQERDERDARVRDMVDQYRNRAYIEANRAAAERGETIRRTGRKITETGEEVPTSNITSPRDIKITPEIRRQIRERVNTQFLAEIREQRAKSPQVSRAEASSREVLIRHLEERFPDPALYNLQLDAGNTPPSEGFLIDAKGQMVAQAVGYGDDHYLPFNLKNLSALKGGEYIRTRSVGGPTTEDIYTGLMTGARSLTVISRSGEFTVDFQDDFRGGRRYNDKALRMTRRYAKLLDSVQSEAVARKQPLSPEVKAWIKESVRRDTPGLSRQRMREEIKTKEQEYKDELEMTAGDEEEHDAWFEDVSQDMPDRQRNALRAAMKNDWRRENEFVFKLNGEGYKDALHALKEQFPYYLKEPRYVPRKALGRIETELDQGYVEPGANRPTRANAGWHGTLTPGGGRNGGGFQSASTVNYARPLYAQRDLPQSRSFHVTPGRPTQEEQDETRRRQTQQAADDAADAAITANGGVALPRAQNAATQAAITAATTQALPQFSSVAVPIQQKLAGYNWQGTLDRFPPAQRLLGTRDPLQAETMLRDPEQARNMVQLMDTYGATFVERNNITREDLRNFRQAAGLITRVPYTPELGLAPTENPFIFTEEPYQPTATPDAVNNEARVLDRRSKSVRGDMPLSEMTDRELRDELSILTQVHGSRVDLAGKSNDDLMTALQGLHVDTTLPAITEIVDNESKLTQTIQDVNRMRALNLNRTRSSEEQTVELPAPAAQTPSSPATVDNRQQITDRANVLRNAAQRLVEVGGTDHEELANKFGLAADTLENTLDENRTTTDEERAQALRETEREFAAATRTMMRINQGDNNNS